MRIRLDSIVKLPFEYSVIRSKERKTLTLNRNHMLNTWTITTTETPVQSHFEDIFMPRHNIKIS